MNPSGFYIKTMSNEQKEELTYLRIRDEGIAIDPEEQEVFLENIPEYIKQSVVNVIK